ncbi:universal stress protein [Halorubellus sp. PRR65]|uniref:universal stress protein n=1 Tax=Halorubellus sp. PRR65 TaxID=3098148 RepID=UPI002B25753B|nr:universal stress protein [Halorubellus sp. PRR65]
MTESAREPTAVGPDLGVANDVRARRDHHETVLLPVGYSDAERVETLATTAAEVAGMMETTVRVLHVFTEARYADVRDRLNYHEDERPAPDELVGRVAPVRDVVGRLEEPLRAWGTTMDVDARVGDDVAGEIVAAAEAVDAKRVLVGGRNRTPTGKVVFGSTAQHVMLNAPCPVTFVRDA